MQRLYFTACERQRVSSGFCLFERQFTMKVKSKLLNCMHLIEEECVLSKKNAKVIAELFNLLDVDETGELNDVIFCQFMKQSTDLNLTRINEVFDILDTDDSGGIDFNEFYIIICILISVKDNMEKQFIYRHSRIVFDILNTDASDAISIDEFINLGFLFNFNENVIQDIFQEFDLSGDKELDYEEFKLFAMGIVDCQNEIIRQRRERARSEAHKADIEKKKEVYLQLEKDGTLNWLVDSMNKDGEQIEIPKSLKKKRWSFL